MLNELSSSTDEAERQTSSEDSITPEFNVPIVEQQQNVQINLGEPPSPAAAGAAVNEEENEVSSGNEIDGGDVALDVEALRALVLKQSQQISTLLEIINKTTQQSGSNNSDDNASETSSGMDYSNFIQFLKSPSNIAVVGDAPPIATVPSADNRDIDRKEIEAGAVTAGREETEVDTVHIYSSPQRVMDERPVSSPPRLAKERLQKNKELSLTSDRQEVIQSRLQQPALSVAISGAREDTTASSPPSSLVPLDATIDSVEHYFPEQDHIERMRSPPLSSSLLVDIVSSKTAAVALPVFTDTSPIKRRVDTTKVVDSRGQTPVEHGLTPSDEQPREDDRTPTTAFIDQHVEEVNILTPTILNRSGEGGAGQIEDASLSPPPTITGELSIEHIEEDEDRATPNETIICNIEQIEDTSETLLVSSSAAVAVLEYIEDFNQGAAEQTIKGTEQTEGNDGILYPVDIDEESPREGTSNDGQDDSGDDVEDEESPADDAVLIPHGHINEERSNVEVVNSYTEPRTFHFLIFFISLALGLSAVAIGVSLSATSTPIDEAESVTSTPSESLSPSFAPFTSPLSSLPTILPSPSQLLSTPLCSAKLSNIAKGLEMPLNDPSFVMVDLDGNNAAAVAREGETSSIYIMFYLLNDSSEWECNGVFIEAFDDDSSSTNLWEYVLASWSQLHCSGGYNITLDALLDFFTIYLPQRIGSCIVNPCPDSRRGEEPV